MKLGSEIILEVDNVSKKFDKRIIIENASFQIKKNTIVGLIGKNGAGKTTLMRMLIGFLRTDSGTIRLDGEDIKHGRSNLKIGYLTDVPVFYDFMTSYEYLHMCAGLKKIKKDKMDSEVTKFLKRVNLEDSKNKRIKGYSRGMKQRLGIAQCLIGNPSLIICDEPMSALDPEGREEVIKILNDIKAETSVLLSTHILTDIERLCDEVIVLDKGIAKLMETKNRFDFSEKSKVMEIDFAGQDFSLIEKFELFLNNHDIAYKKEKKKILILDSRRTVIKKIYHYFGDSDNKWVYPNSIKMLDASIDDIF